MKIRINMGTHRVRKNLRLGSPCHVDILGPSDGDGATSLHKGADITRVGNDDLLRFDVVGGVPLLIEATDPEASTGSLYVSS
jgi:hypothetical protein